MRLALDYDGTFTADPELWRAFVRLARERGHNVVCVTARAGRMGAACEVRLALEHLGVPVMYVGAASKRAAVEDAGLTVDVWIDDMPEAIVR